ncbi:MAG: exodeoxyribonuclease VII large subunit [Gammaproteobacteria bacterium]|nr:exodeoxyribonuclease VII large subunit [Gammaproteobacteria bacterium]OUX76232.1 MAG: exodeoxyribonuclease VII large subunit [Oceanospirillales bacterium TMED59]
MSEQVTRSENALTVSTLAALLTQALTEFFPQSVILDAEISNFKTYPSGHWYFSLTDGDASLSAVMFKGANRLVRLIARDGLKVRVRCDVNFYPPNGRLQLIVKHMAEAGVGDQKAKLEALKAKLIAEGMTDLARKKSLPVIPRCIGLITSPKGAVIQDMLTILRRRWPLASIRLYSAAVQGDMAPEELAHALQQAVADGSADVLIIGRGGGAAEDLSAFNDEHLCRAIAACHIPIISAVGHETDTGLTDLVADVRSATPSQAAEIATPDMGDIQRQLSQFEGRLTSRADTLIALAQQRFELTTHKLSTTISQQTHRSRERLRQLEQGLVAPTEYIVLKRHDVNHLSKRLSRATDQMIQVSRSALAHLSTQLNTLSPLATLGRGYGILLKGDATTDRSIGSVDDVSEKTPVEIRLKDGRLNATITQILKDTP